MVPSGYVLAYLTQIRMHLHLASCETRQRQCFPLASPSMCMSQRARQFHIVARMSAKQEHCKKSEPVTGGPSPADQPAPSEIVSARHQESSRSSRGGSAHDPCRVWAPFTCPYMLRIGHRSRAGFCSVMRIHGPRVGLCSVLRLHPSPSRESAARSASTREQSARMVAAFR